MVHELIGIKNGRVDLSNVPGIKPELKVIFLSQDRYCCSQLERRVITVALKTWTSLALYIGK